MNDSSTPTTPSTPAPATTTPVASSPQGPQAEIGQSEAAKMAQWAKEDLAKGKITAEQAEKIFTDLNTPLAQRLPDTRTPEEKQLDAAFPKADASAYTIRYGGPGEDVVMTPELKQFDSTARGWMSSAGLPRDIGNSLVNAIDKTTQATAHMTEGELEAYGHKQFELLRRVHGEKLEERLHAAALMVDQLEQTQPGLKTLLQSRGIGDNAVIANMLISHAPIYHARKGR